VGVVVDGRYRIVEPLAAGGMGSVYLGEQDNLHRQVAIKLIRQPDPEDAERFRREAEALAAVSHPAIVEVYDYLHEAAGEASGDVSYLVMAYVKGDNVADYAAGQAGGVLPPLEAVELLLPVASALVELHAHGILHRDLKPANLVRYVRADGRAAVKLVDFGIVRREQDAGLTAAGLIVGTPPYLSAEVVLGKRHSEASDVYGFGATLYELIVGEPPHGKGDVHRVLKRIIREDVHLPPGLAGTDLGVLLLRLLAREPEQRPSMQAVLEKLEQIRLALVQQTGDVAAVVEATRTMCRSPDTPTIALRSTPTTAGTPSAAAARLSPVPWMVAGVAVMVAVVVTLYFTLRQVPPEPSARARPTAAASGREARSGADARPAMGSAAAPEPMRPAPVRPMRPRPAAKTAVEVPAEALAREKARCTSRNKAYAMFRRATFFYRLKQRLPWVKAVFAALLDCKHTSPSQRRWVAYRLALLHTRAGACGHADRRWNQYLAAARVIGVPPVRRPPCRERK
jgi:serine/threonine-protein kinase